MAVLKGIYPGLSGGGCISRDAEGSIIWAQAEFLGIQTSIITEAKALLIGLRRCVLEGRIEWNIGSGLTCFNSHITNKD